MKVKVTVSSRVDVSKNEAARLRRMSPEELLEYLGAVRAELKVKFEGVG